MDLSPGDRLGHYEITAAIGKGGMGTVYRARDTRLGRDVAIKVSAAQFSERFEREARVIASLNHPNICTLHDVGPNYLVMEFVEGESPKGPLPLDAAIRIARQITDALEAAHEKGITHRDLKPANIKVRPDGTVKVLDFGLAKIATPSPNRDREGAEAPTLTMGMSEAGAIMGTPAYMAPEQARGEPVDKRADIFAFGIVFYELLTGDRMFSGATLSDTLAAVLRDTPNLNRVPVHVRRLLTGCLEKSPRQRLRDAGDVWKLLDDSFASTLASPASNGGGKSRLPWTISALATSGLALALALWAPWRPPPPSPAPVRFQTLPGASGAAGAFAVSPDNRRIAFVNPGPDGVVRLWLRDLDSLETRSLPGTETLPDLPPIFWSPDSRSIAYQTVGKLMRVDIAGGPPRAICDLTSGLAIGGSWNQEGVILFGVNGGGVMRVPAEGGTPAPATKLSPDRADSVHVFPFFLPDGHRFIYLNVSSKPENSGIYAGSLDVPLEQQPSVKLASTNLFAVYAPAESGGPGWLLFRRDATLLAQRFDPAKLEVSGEAVPIADKLGSFLANALFSASPSVLVYLGGGTENSILTWLDRKGRALGTVGDPGFYSSMDISPNGKQAALSRVEYSSISMDLWLLDFTAKTTSRLTFGPGFSQNPVFSPDGTRIAYRAQREGGENLFMKLTSGAQNEELLLKSPETKTPSDWSRDGRYLLYSTTNAKTHSDLWVLPLEDRKPFPFLQTDANEADGHFSPDGKWIAYVSNETGHDEVWVRAFSPGKPEVTGKWLVSKGGGNLPRWLDNGELTYTSLDLKRMAVAVTPGPVFRSATPVELFPFPTGFFAGAVAPDGRTLVAVPVRKETLEPLTVVLHWQSALKK